jgi:putative acetyltransferase
VIRPAQPSDVRAVAEIWHEGWHDAHAGHVPDGLTAARTLPAFRERVEAAVPVTTVAVVEAGVAGFVMVVDDEVEQVFVARRHRGGGVAEVLLDEAERQVAAAYDVAWLAVVAGNARARRFYERRGWVDEGDLPYEVTAAGETFVSPCRRYTKRVR